MDSAKKGSRKRQSNPQLPRIVWERLRKKYPHSLIFLPIFHDVRLQILSKKLESTLPPEEFGDELPQVLRATATKPGDMGTKGGNWLHVAVTQGDLPLAHECIRLGSAIQYKDRRGYSALYLGCTVLKDLLIPTGLVAGAVVSLPGGRTPDSNTADEILDQMVEICLLLLAHHSDPNETHDNLSLLGLACLSGRGELIKGLLIHGANPTPPSPTQLPGKFLATQQARISFATQASRFSGKPRPRRLCPCGSERLLDVCHGQTVPQPYPDDGICPCGGGKIYSLCCVKRTDMYWAEKWDRREEELKRLAIPRVTKDPSMQEGGAEIMFEANSAAKHDILRGNLESAHRILRELHKSGRIDPAYVAVGCQVSFLPLFPAAVRTMSKIDLNNAVRIWNEFVDGYINAGVDSRTREEIENAAKVGPTGGPLYRRCEAEGCPKIEGRNDVKLSRCAGCSKAVYCSSACQKLSWKTHRSACKNGEAKVQLLPSQAEFNAEMSKSMIDKLATLDLPAERVQALVNGFFNA
ncbi:hypothetical protein B0H16DRAFT_1542592 [Mycena metata]|uniref:MYND-type domain-containing protein n=1 Tax=Mycena metata TaxID=1033252 RepID=A0AAD7J0X4_9AGAR|nr:hypothetical protein B0H16DRAFT_1542592 [Mycena metata]